MSMKLTDLMKLKGKKIEGRMSGASDRFGKGALEVLDKKEQRRRDHEAGLVPFAVKLHGDLIRQLHAHAQERSVSLNELTAQLLSTALGMPAAAPGSAPAAPKAEAAPKPAATPKAQAAPKAAPAPAAVAEKKPAPKTRRAATPAAPKAEAAKPAAKKPVAKKK